MEVFEVGSFVTDKTNCEGKTCESGNCKESKKSLECSMPRKLKSCKVEEEQAIYDLVFS